MLKIFNINKIFLFIWQNMEQQDSDVKKDFLDSMGIKIDRFDKLGRDVQILIDIANDYEKHRNDLLDEASYIANKLQRCKGVHTVRSRVKDTDHVVEKIIRKWEEKRIVEKYDTISKNNYKEVITDLVGVRAIYLFRKDWELVHNLILSKWEKQEEVVIYYRNGDDLTQYEGYQDCERKEHDKGYRSIHYIIPATKIDGLQVCCEVQTRTIFDEGWSEIDHNVRYPSFLDDPHLQEFLNIFNRLAGSADEMGSYVNELVTLIKNNKTLELDRIKREEESMQEQEKYKSEIERLSADDRNINKLKDTYEKIFNVQKNEIEALRLELISQTNENLRLNRKEPMVKYINQNSKLNEDGSREGTIKIEVIRTNNFATFTGQFDPCFEVEPNKIEIDGKVIDVEGINTDKSKLTFKIGVGKNTDFNVHLFNKSLGYVEVGKYTFRYKARVKESI